MSTAASNTEARSCESTEARRTPTIKYEKWLERIVGSRAQKRLPPSVAGTEATTFNACAMLPPNPTVTGNVIGNKHPSNLHFSSFIPRDGQKYDSAQYSRHDIPSRHPSRHSKSVLPRSKAARAPNPRAGTSLLEEGSGNESQRFNNPRCDYYRDVQACLCLSQSKTMYRGRILKRTRHHHQSTL